MEILITQLTMMRMQFSWFVIYLLQVLHQYGFFYTWITSTKSMCKTLKTKFASTSGLIQHLEKRKNQYKEYNKIKIEFKAAKQEKKV